MGLGRDLGPVAEHPRQHARPVHGLVLAIAGVFEVRYGCPPDQGGVSFKASRRGGELILEVHQDEWIDDAPPVITSYPLTSEQWRELVELARVDDLWNWRPSSRAHADCQTCQVSLDDHVARFCGTLDGPDRGAALRRRLESLAVASGWTR
jgi:hypothetical protein